MRVLFLCAKEYVDRKLPRTRFHAIEALGKIADVTYSGIGFDNWVDGSSVLRNTGQTFGHQFDWIIVYKPDQYHGWNEAGIPPVCQTFNDCWAKADRTRDMLLPNTRLAIMHHANEMAEWVKFLPMVKFVNIPYSVKTSMFKDWGSQKPIDILLTGAIDEEIYPLRYRFKRMIERKAFGTDLVVVHLPHQGYRLDNPEEAALAYAHTLNSAKICLVDSSKYGYAAEKHHEIPACRSLLCGDIPEERQADFSKFILKVPTGCLDSSIIKGIRTILENPDAIKKRTDIGYKYVHDNFTMEQYAKRLLYELESAI